MLPCVFACSSRGRLFIGTAAHASWHLRAFAVVCSPAHLQLIHESPHSPRRRPGHASCFWGKTPSKAYLLCRAGREFKTELVEGGGARRSVRGPTARVGSGMGPPPTGQAREAGPPSGNGRHTRPHGRGAVGVWLPPLCAQQGILQDSQDAMLPRQMLPSRWRKAEMCALPGAPSSGAPRPLGRPVLRRSSLDPGTEDRGQRRREAGSEPRGRSGGARKDSVFLGSSASHIPVTREAPLKGDSSDETSVLWAWQGVCTNTAVGRGSYLCSLSPPGLLLSFSCGIASPCPQSPTRDTPEAPAPGIGTGCAAAASGAVASLAGAAFAIFASLGGHGPGVCSFSPLN